MLYIFGRLVRGRFTGTRWRGLAALAAAIALALYPACACALDSGRTVYVMVAESSWLNIRERPEAHAPVTLRLTRGDELTVYRIGTDGWAEVCRAGDPGYCRAAYLCDDAPADAVRCRTAAPRLKVRAAPGGKVLRRLRQNTPLTVRGWLTDDDGARWANIGDGFVLASCLAAAESP